jgi:creatinine amidohydrolase/Fe(II)-dependent formamide hydrolase-like protein
MESKNCPGHASEFETSFALAAFPHHVHWEGVDYDTARLTFFKPEQAEDDRKKHHEAKLATAKKGEVMINVAVEWVVGILKEMIA